MAHQNLGYFPHNQVNWRLGLVRSFQAYYRHSRPISLAFTILFVQSYSSYSSKKKYLFSFYSHFYSTMSSSDGTCSLASSSSEDTDIDVVDYNLEVEGSPNSSTQVFFFSVGRLYHKKVLDVAQYLLLGLECFCIQKQHTQAFSKQRCPPCEQSINVLE